jgi:SAM-dependent methyltransferase
MDTEVLMRPLIDQADYYNKRWAAFKYINLYSLERCIFVLRSICDLGLKDPRICDLGCGAGWLSGILSTIGPTVGVDLSPEAVERATERYPDVHFICADAVEWQPVTHGFDIVVSQEVIEHISDKRAYLAVVHRALRPGGYLVMTTPNLDVLNAVRTARRKAVWEIQPVELPLTRSELNKLLSECGFQVLSYASVLTGCGTLGFQRLLNSSKLDSLLSVCGLAKAWRRFLGRAGYGMYLTTVAQAVHRPS